jgi:hypothetical protein
MKRDPPNARRTSQSAHAHIKRAPFVFQVTKFAA